MLGVILVFGLFRTFVSKQMLSAVFTGEYLRDTVIGALIGSISTGNPDLQRGKEDGGSFIIDYDQVEFRKHDKGGIRNFFRRSTAMCPYYEMHITNLNPGIKSHRLVIGKSINLPK